MSNDGVPVTENDFSLARASIENRLDQCGVAEEISPAMNDFLESVIHMVAGERAHARATQNALHRMTFERKPSQAEKEAVAQAAAKFK